MTSFIEIDAIFLSLVAKCAKKIKLSVTIMFYRAHQKTHINVKNNFLKSCNLFKIVRKIKKDIKFHNINYREFANLIDEQVNSISSLDRSFLDFILNVMNVILSVSNIRWRKILKLEANVDYSMSLKGYDACLKFVSFLLMKRSVY